MIDIKNLISATIYHQLRKRAGAYTLCMLQVPNRTHDYLPTWPKLASVFGFAVNSWTVTTMSFTASCNSLRSAM